MISSASAEALPANEGPDVVAGDIANMQTESAQIAGVGRRDHRADPEKIRHLGGEQPARSAERHHGVIAGFASAHRRNLTNAEYLVCRRDLERTGGKFIGIQPKFLAERNKRPPRGAAASSSISPPTSALGSRPSTTAASVTVGCVPPLP